MIGFHRLFLLLLGLITLTTLHAWGSGGYDGYSIVTVYPDGGVMLMYRLTVKDAPANITLKVPRNAIYISAYDGGEPAPYLYDEARGLLSLVTFSGDVMVKVYVLELTSKEGAIWRLQLGSVDFETLVALPTEALIVTVKPGDFTVRLVNNTLYLVFKPGSYVEIEYVLTPKTTPAPATEPAPLPEQTTPTRGFAPTTLLLLAGILALAIVAGALLLLRTRRAASKLLEVTALEEGLDERDKLILETLKNMGEATAPTLQKATGIPKTPLYRKLEKLEKMGLIESEWKGGAKAYRIKTQRQNLNR
jgi:uncharacterized membrane protein